VKIRRLFASFKNVEGTTIAVDDHLLPIGLPIKYLVR